MSAPSPETLLLANQLQERLAGESLVREFARLYSQHTRLQTRRPGLRSWTTDEAGSRLEDALQLLDAGLVQRDAGQESFRASMRRAGELLEWLSHPENNPEGIPLHLVSAAVYQLAGYPARAGALLMYETEGNGESTIIRKFLRGDFPSLLASILAHWAEHSPQSMLESGPPSNPQDAESWLQERVVQEVASALGVLCSAFRWGRESRLSLALQKLSAAGRVLLQDRDSYSWLLAKLCAEVGNEYTTTSMRSLLEGFDIDMAKSGKQAIERYLRIAYLTKRAVAWPSQAAGIKKLRTERSFVLCTPTGSGKTTIAELAIIQGLFGAAAQQQADFGDAEKEAPLALYLVPSRALAAEVESKLSRVLRRLSDDRVIVTGLYGGTDWGPTDAWLTPRDKTVLICTYQKAEALLRFLGPLFLGRIKLIIIDEAHAVQLDDPAYAQDVVRSSENRSLRLESLGMRLFDRVEQNEARVIALSAVAAGMEDALAGWVTGSQTDGVVKSEYRSTRQLVGRLECLSGRGFEIHYDLLDGADLRFGSGNASETPYIPNPFPPHPPAPQWEGAGPIKRLHPYLLWTALHLAAPDDKGHRHSVLVSITQDIEDYASNFLKLLDSTWAAAALPEFFASPSDPEKIQTWERCLRSCEDYFGPISSEYRLLRKGIVLHYGRMPGLLARLLVEVVQEGIASIVVATSTLTEGVNLPFETILIPSLQRWSTGGVVDLGTREFRNLIGRAGRPGHGTEGRALVLLCQDSGHYGIRQARQRYFSLIDAMIGETTSRNTLTKPSSALAVLINELFRNWQRLSGRRDSPGFIHWLESTAPEEAATAPDAPIDSSGHGSLDTFDGVLLSTLVEIEEVANTKMSVAALEDRLRRIWRRSYAHFSASETPILESAFLTRSIALRANFYPDPSARRRLYKTCLPPRSGQELLDAYPSIRETLQGGAEYAAWPIAQRVNYLTSVVGSVGRISRFRLNDLKVGKSTTHWQDVFSWWVSPTRAATQPTPSQISRWHRFVSDAFVYRFSWGLGSILSIATDEVHEGMLRPTKLDEWPLTGLPWIVLWIKELVIWGTSDPVAAYLLARSQADTRRVAEAMGRDYYAQNQGKLANDELLAPSNIQAWTERRVLPLPESRTPGPTVIAAELVGEFSLADRLKWRVLPIAGRDELLWYDCAGYLLARSSIPDRWESDFAALYDFVLDVSKRTVRPSRYF